MRKDESGVAMVVCCGGWLAGKKGAAQEKEKEQGGLLMADKGREWVCCDWRRGGRAAAQSRRGRVVEEVKGTTRAGAEGRENKERVKGCKGCGAAMVVSGWKGRRVRVEGR
ncbi:hypothetical protein OIU85_003918 [Salix viminalis]|uniref:Uncharacterized protein n=1 Tax=Salix viminalis TaxID=40686 RepID=A0A9Q0T220_SALVM|nr:hypothetical protein OIU85_003918 [Salix viminalis]